MPRGELVSRVSCTLRADDARVLLSFCLFSVLFFVARWQPEAGTPPQVFWAPTGCSSLLWMSRGLCARSAAFADVRHFLFLPVHFLLPLMSCVCEVTVITHPPSVV